MLFVSSSASFGAERGYEDDIVPYGTISHTIWIVAV
jgi:hypothetical protein